MYLDQKITTWQRVHFNSEEEMNQAIEKLKQDSSYNINDVCEDFELCSENLFETETILYPQDNDDFSTIEVYNSKAEIVYENGSNQYPSNED